MLHIHFGAGRLGLGLIAPFFQRPGSELFILNRAVSGVNATGSTGLTAERRNALLQLRSPGHYRIEPPGQGSGAGETVRFDAFFAFEEANVGEIIERVVDASATKMDGVLVTASVLKLENYKPVVRALNVLGDLREQGSVGPVYLIACENTISARDVFDDPEHSPGLTDNAHRHVTCVHALVDRMCVGMEEDCSGPEPVVVVRAEAYGSVKLQLGPETEELPSKLGTGRLEFSRHVDTEKQVKGWLLNGTHWLIALAAFEESGGDRELKLNHYLRACPERERFAHDVMAEMREGVAAILRKDDRYSRFVADIDPDDYLRGASDAIMRRFLDNEDPITRILARFQAPSAEAPSTVDQFWDRFADRVKQPISSFRAAKGFAPPAATRGVESFNGLVASHTFITADADGGG